MKDSIDVIDLEFNQSFNKAITLLNKRAHFRKKGCNQDDLYKELKKYFSNKYKGKFTKWLVKSDQISRVRIPIKESIYGGIKFKEAFIQGGLAKISDPSAALLKVNGFMIGDDKFEHFFGSGFRYFKTYYLKGNSIERTLRIGTRAEYGLLGAKTTGVIAYADMVANFNGMRFWNHILNKYDDVLGNKYNSIGPYVKCENNKWKQVKIITFKTYIDAAFDEGINCSDFSKQSIVDRIKNKILQLEKNDKLGRSYVCPIRPRVIPTLQNKYIQFSDLLINTNGQGLFTPN